MTAVDKFRARLAAQVMPLFQDEAWFNCKGPSDWTYFAKMAVELADAIIASVENSDKSFNKNRRV